MWSIEGTDEFRDWYWSRSDDQRRAVAARIDMLEASGPALGRPVVAEIDGSSIKNLKELRCSKDGALRVLFVFDPRSTGILLIGGDKAGAWKAWYAENIPLAEQIYKIYLQDLRDEGVI